MHTFLFGFVMLDKPPMERHKANRWSRFKCLRVRCGCFLWLEMEWTVDGQRKFFEKICMAEALVAASNMLILLLWKLLAMPI
uniref:Uncharacterized protein n=2 Tax=Meloidogyne TaxID=189290 RepID=A0A6V7UHA4_MELEN|nr:unnamed protein product [Meloidogyne enterolobii]